MVLGRFVWLIRWWEYEIYWNIGSLRIMGGFDSGDFEESLKLFVELRCVVL